ncbi:MAG: hypothetical protein NC099_05670 [Corallococcus sp.]|nr:hypothetical protein [Corallococcus sp.]
MKNKRRYVYLLIFVTMIIFLFLTFAGCWDDFGSNPNNKDQIIELTMDNYEYYLSIDKVLNNHGNAANGSIHYWNYNCTIYGAVSGLYKDCSITYMLGETEHEVKLNAAGFASFSYTESTKRGAFKFTNVKGVILL